jgi:hypothetical protein
MMASVRQVRNYLQECIRPNMRPDVYSCENRGEDVLLLTTARWEGKALPGEVFEIRVRRVGEKPR